MDISIHLSGKRKKQIKKILRDAYYIISLNFLDDYIEKKFMDNLHKKKVKYQKRALDDFINLHPEIDNAHINILNDKLKLEIERVYDIVDKSLLKAGIKRAKYILIATLLITAIVIGILTVATHGAAISALPLLTPIIAWALSITTIPIAYTERIVGGIDAVLHAFEQDIAKEANAKINTKQFDINDKIYSTKELLSSLSSEKVSLHQSDFMLSDSDYFIQIIRHASSEKACMCKSSVSDIDFISLFSDKSSSSMSDDSYDFPQYSHASYR